MSIQAFAGYVDLASAAVGGAALAASDEWFAGREHLVVPAPAAFDPSTYGERGKIMDGWESRRKRVGGHDWAIVRLGVPGRIVGVDIDTAHFLGNHPPFASLDACRSDDDGAVVRGEVRWERVLDSVPLDRGSHNLQPVLADGTFTHVRLNIYPDGGVARLRVYGVPRPAPSDGRIDLAALVNGGQPLACSDMFFSPMQNLILPTRSAYMGGGWETRRSRPPGRDWIVVALGQPGRVEEILLDTAHFKGNYPDRAVVDGLWWPDAPPQALVGSEDWVPITAETRLAADCEHHLPCTAPGPWTHVRLRIVPDGGVARMRVWGRPAEASIGDDPVLRAVDAADADALARCCGSARWVEAMAAGRPYRSRTHLLGHAAQVWWHLDERDWLEAFSHHPRIGADADTLRQRFAGTADLSAREQAGAADAEPETLSALAAENAAYEARFGHVFLICATGLSAATMLAALRARIGNDPATELRVAAGEQAKITRLRLQGMGGR
ncbi:MAG: allantoicase [Myxococcota bacterium]